MRFRFKNINVVKCADIKLDGLTVIAGENGCGKSTVGKLLFSTVKAVSNLGSTKESYKRDLLTKHVRALYKRLFGIIRHQNPQIDTVFPYPSSRLVNIFMKIYNDDLLEASTKEKRYIELLTPMRLQINAMTELTPRIKKLLNDDLDNILICLTETNNLAADLVTEIKYLIESEFMNRICSFGTENSSIIIEFDDKDSLISFDLDNDEIKAVSIKADPEQTLRDATYIESPLYMHMLDSLMASSTFLETPKNARMSLRGMIPLHIKDIAEKIDSAKYVKEEQIQELKIDENGAFIFKDRALYYRKDGVLYSPINVASGLKSFGLIQILLETNAINESKILIWDEPENHLHPKWQIALASVLVEMVRNGIPVLISTHSPYFVQSIRYFAAKYEVEKYVNYYLAEKEDETSLATIKDVTTDLNRIFIKLAAPLNDIMNIPEAK